jgi:hypothetical protein
MVVVICEDAAMYVEDVSLDEFDVSILLVPL